MNLWLTLIALVLLGTAGVALSLRNLIHSALLLVVSWLSLAVLYLWADAQFAAFAQALVYAGAISMVVLFAVLLTGQPSPRNPMSRVSFRRGVIAVLTGAGVAGVLVYGVLSSPLPWSARAAPTATVREIGTSLMGTHAAALLIIGALLTVALIGAVTVAARSTSSKPEDPL